MLQKNIALGRGKRKLCGVAALICVNLASPVQIAKSHPCKQKVHITCH